MVKDLEATLQGLGKDVELLIYEDADHAFFNDTRPEVYKPERPSRRGTGPSRSSARRSEAVRVTDRCNNGNKP